MKIKNKMTSKRFPTSSWTQDPCFPEYPGRANTWKSEWTKNDSACDDMGECSWDISSFYLHCLGHSLAWLAGESVHKPASHQPTSHYAATRFFTHHLMCELFPQLPLKLLLSGFPGGAVVESLPANAGDMGSIPGLGRSHMLRSNRVCEPQLLSLRVWSLCSATREAAIVRGPRTAMKSGPRLLQLEKTLAQKRRPNTDKNK